MVNQLYGCHWHAQIRKYATVEHIMITTRTRRLHWTISLHQFKTKDDGSRVTVYGCLLQKIILRIITKAVVIRQLTRMNLVSYQFYD